MKNFKKIIPIMMLLLLANNAIAKTRIIYQRFGYGQYYNEYYNHKITRRRTYVNPYYPDIYSPYIIEREKSERTKYSYNINSGLELNNEFLLIEKDDEADLKLKNRVDILDFAAEKRRRETEELKKGVKANETNLEKMKTRVNELDLQAEYNRKEVEILKKDNEENKKKINDNISKIENQKKELEKITKTVENNKLEQEQTNERLSAGIATSIAMASIPQVSEGRLFSIGFGGAYYNKQGGFAIGISGTENSRRVVYKVTAGINTKKEFAAGAGFNINFGTTTSRAMVSPSINVEDQSESKNKIKELQEQINELKKIVEELKRKVK